MADLPQYSVAPPQLDMQQILHEARNRWLQPAEICEIIHNYERFRIALEPPNKPPSGSLFLFDHNADFRKDSHNWRKKKDGTIVAEAHEMLKDGSVDVLSCYYAHGEDNETFQRRIYSLLEGEYSHIVLVQYLELKGSKAQSSNIEQPLEYQDKKSDIAQILHEAEKRWLQPIEICEILRNYEKFRLAPEPPNKPQSGSIFLFDRRVVRYFRRDNHNWRKKNDGRTVKEAHDKLKVENVDALHCYYAHSEDNVRFQRRSYFLIEAEYSHIMLVHYLEPKLGKQTLRSKYFVTSPSRQPSQFSDAQSSISTLTSEHGDIISGKCIFERVEEGIDMPMKSMTSKVEELDVIEMNEGQLIYGRQDDMKRMIELLTSYDYSEKNNVRLIFLVAERGVGKNTLVQLVYNYQTVSDTFETRIFVRMSKKFDEKRVMKTIIESLTRFPCDVTDQSLLEGLVKEELSGKKCLIVCDDAQNEDIHFWERVVAVLSSVVVKGSAIMVTTKNIVVTGTDQGVACIYNLSYLSYDTCWVIFKQHAFDGRDENDHAELVNIGKCLVAKCGCIPLCVKVLGGLLKDRIDDKVWSSMLESELWEMDESAGEVLPALRVCYNFLHVNLKICIEYCALFPKDYAYAKNHLVCLWISQGFIEPSVGKEFEEIGGGYFDELVSISFFQHSPVYHGKFVMHPLVHDLAQFASRNECFRSEDSLLNVPINVSHFSLVPYEFETITLEPIIEEARNWLSFLTVNMSVFQNETVVSPIVHLAKLNEMFLNLTHIATLNLSNTDIEELPNSIGSMKNLRYLGLNNTNIKNIPLEIGNIINLQTFEAKDCNDLAEIPETTKNLINLRHLNLWKESGYVGMPVGIGQLTNLRTLGTFNVGPDSSHCAIGELKHLNSLKGCKIAGLENIANGKDACEANLKDKTNLETLSLHWDGDVTEYMEEDDQSLEVANEVLNGLNPYYNLKELAVRNYPGVNFPIWMEDSSFSNLVSVILDNCPYCTQLPALGELPSLRYLSIQKMYNLQKMDILCSTYGVKKFQSLETLSLWEMYGLEEMFEIEEGDFQCLRTLSISRCPFMRKIPKFTSLVELSLHCCTEIPDISGFLSLKFLKIDGFMKIKSIDIRNIVSVLDILEISNCPELLSVEGLSHPSSFGKFKLFGCPKMNMSIYAQIGNSRKRKNLEPDN